MYVHIKKVLVKMLKDHAEILNISSIKNSASPIITEVNIVV